MDGETMIGRVVLFKPEQHFGFAVASGLDDIIHFHLSGAYQVSTGPDGYVLGTIRDRLVEPYSNENDPQWIVMLVNKTKRGLRATKWGVRPGPNWAHAATASNEFDQFIGTWFEHRGTHGRLFVSDVIQAITLTPEQLDIGLADRTTRSFRLDKSSRQESRDGTCITLSNSTRLYFTASSSD